MKKLKKLLKRILKIDAFSNYTPLDNLVNIGFVEGSYHIPAGFIDETSVCYCIGAGIDISFDTELVVMYNCNVYIFDPMPEGKNHYQELTDSVNQKKTLVVGADRATPFQYRINTEQMKKVTYLELGVWDMDTTVKFYEPSEEDYMSHSILNLQKSDKYIEAKVDRLSNIMKKLNHKTLDLVKIEIEGAEYRVIETIVEDKLDIKVILVEYDEFYNHAGYAHLFRIKKSTDLLLNAGYKMVYASIKFKRTFVRRDIYDSLLAKQIKSGR